MAWVLSRYVVLLIQLYVIRIVRAGTVVTGDTNLFTTHEAHKGLSFRSAGLGATRKDILHSFQDPLQGFPRPKRRRIQIKFQDKASWKPTASGTLKPQSVQPG